MTQQNRDPLFGDIVSTPWGSIAIMNNSRHIVKVQFVSRSESDKFDLYPNDLSNKIVLQLCEYFDARRKTFSLPIKLTGSAFQVAVWQQLSKISWGTTCSYGEMAKAIGHPKAARAVGSANHCNPLPIIIPCHRVIGAKGELRGFAGGKDWKIKLLAHEGVTLKQG